MTLLVAALGSLSSVAFAARGNTFTAVLTGGQEVPPVSTEPTGVTQFKMNRSQSTIAFDLHVSTPRASWAPPAPTFIARLEARTGR